MSEFDPIEFLTKRYPPGSFIAENPWIDPMTPGTAPFSLDELILPGIVTKRHDQPGYYMATFEEMARRCDDRLSKIEQRGDRSFDLVLEMPSAPRAYAFDVVADEMAYGDRCLVDPTRSDCSSKSHVEHLALIEHCCAEARRRFYDEPGQDGVGDEIRKMKAQRAWLD